jgi:hypothetical protein
MIKKALCTVLTLITLSTIGHAKTAETCYNVEGDVNTINVSENAQQGTIKLVLKDELHNEVFSDSGELYGLITGASSDGTIFLSHTALFSKKMDRFITIGDKSIITGIRKLNDDDVPCSYFISENINTIAFGSGFFKKVTSVNINADGFISTCISENENGFDLSGEICVK